MKKHMTRNVILMAILDVALGIVLSLYIASTGTVPAADNADTYADGAYSASAQGYESEVTVMINITGGKVTNVQIDAGDETPDVGGGKPCPQPAGCRRHGRCGHGLGCYHDQQRGAVRYGCLPCTGRAGITL